MKERDLDRAIDAAAGAMMTREPSRSFGHTVMARVHDDHSPAPRRFVWVTAAASLVVCGAIAIALMIRVPATVVPLPRAAQLTVGQPATLPSVPAIITTETVPTRRVISAPRIASSTATRTIVLPDRVSPIEPIQTHPIVLSSIEVPQLERETTAIDTLHVEPLTIEPLATSND